MKKNCEVCGNKKLTKILDLGKNPLCDDLIKIGSKKKNKLYKIQILFCKKCLTGFQKYEVRKKDLFPKSYHYRARFTNDVLKGFKEIIKSSKNILKNLKNKTILDIGCNDGSLLNYFKKNGAKTVGVEPTNAALEAKKNGHFIYQKYFDDDVSSKIKKKYKKVDLIIFTNVFAHIENLNSLISNLKKIIDQNTFLLIENHYFGAILKKRQFDTFYHEHPRTYSATSFIEIAKKLDMTIDKIEFPKRYGGNIRVLFSKKKNKKLKFASIRNRERSLLKKILQIQNDVNIWKKNKKDLIKNLNKKYGPLTAKAFPGRAAILIKLLNLKTKHIEVVHEKNGSMKIGHYVPGTRIPIKSDFELFKKFKNLKVILNFSWHISKEIKNYLRNNGYKGKIYNILENKDFTKRRSKHKLI